MRYQPLPSSFHAGRRQAFIDQLPAGAVAIIETNPKWPRSGDTTMPFRPNSNFFYLTGIDQVGVTLVIANGTSRLFMPDLPPALRLWDGEGYSLSQAEELSGVGQVQGLSALKRYLDEVLPSAAAVYLNGHMTESSLTRSTPTGRRRASIKRAYPELEIRSADPILAAMRMIKQPEEIDQIRRAIEITAAGFESARLIKAGTYEYEIEAALTHEFVRRGAAGHAYEPIVAKGANAATIHYIRNDEQVRDHDLVLIDAGAEYGWYAADITRTLCIDRMTTRQQAVYEAVLRIQKSAIEMMVPGARLREIERRIGELMTQELIQIGVLDQSAKADPEVNRLYREYYPHAFSHHLGLDVHDVGDLSRPLEAGMVLTCEPGIYLKDEAIGVRLEDDILITADGNENLSAQIPI